MADIWRTRNALIAQAPDNTSGAITAQVMRDFMFTTMPAVTSVSGTYTVLSTDSFIDLKPSGTTSYTVTLPDAVGVSGKTYYFHKQFAPENGTVTVTASGSQLMNGYASITMNSRYSLFSTYSNGSSWENIIDSDYLGWKDIVGNVNVRSGPTAPSFTAIGGSGFYAYEMVNSGNDYIFNEFHIPHDYAPGTEMYIHTHWIAANATAGNVTWDWRIAYAKGYAQAAFNLDTPTTVSVTTANPASGAWTHMISEVKFTDIAGGSGLINSSNIQTDGIILSRVERNASDSYASSVWLLFVDLHYQARKVSTKNRNYPFD